jgi:ESCRT-II complex subunit VPS25
MNRFKELFDYPPFWTLQTNPASLSQQLQLWSIVIREQMRIINKTEITISAVLGHPPFANPAINRSLSQTALTTILDHMVGTKHAEYLDDVKARVRVYWRSLDDWGNIMWKCMDDIGALNQVRTVRELHSDSEFNDRPFHGLPPELVLRILQSLEERGKAKVIKPKNPAAPVDEYGVKFLPPTP